MTTTATEPAAEKQHGAEEEPEIETSSVILLFTGLMLAMFMFSLNQTMLATALPTIVGDLNGVDQMLWVSTAFMLASTIMMPIYGKLGDSFNRKKIFIFAICMFILGSVVGFLPTTWPSSSPHASFKASAAAVSSSSRRLSSPRLCRLASAARTWASWERTSRSPRWRDR